MTARIKPIIPTDYRRISKRKEPHPQQHKVLNVSELYFFKIYNGILESNLEGMFLR